MTMLDSTDVDKFVPLFYGVTISSLLAGITISQLYIYSLFEPKKWLLKGWMLILVLSSLLAGIIATVLIDHNVIGSYQDPNDRGSLLRVKKYTYFVLFAIYLLNTLSLQLFVARRLLKDNTKICSRTRHLTIDTDDPKLVYLGFFMIFACVAELGLAILVFQKISNLPPTYITKPNHEYIIILGVWNSLAIAVDLAGSIGLFRAADEMPIGFRSFIDLMSLAVTYSANRGLLLLVFRVIFVSIWFVKSDSLYWMPFYLCLTGLNLITMLSILNTYDTERNPGGKQADKARISISRNPQDSSYQLGASHLQLSSSASTKELTFSSESKVLNADKAQSMRLGREISNDSNGKVAY